MRPFEVVFADGSAAGAGERADHLFELFRADVNRIFTKGNLDGTHLRIVEKTRAAAIFEGGCSARVKDKAEFERLIYRSDANHAQDGVILYCYDAAAKRVSLALFGQDGAEITRIVTRTYSPGIAQARPTMMTGLILKGVRVAMVELLLTLFPFEP